MSQVENLNKRRRTAPGGDREKPVLRPTLRKVDKHLVSLVAPDSPEAEQYRMLRYEVENLHDPGESTVVAVCSAIPGDGKTTTAINLAGCLAQDPQARVLLIDADLRRPEFTIGKRLALNEFPERGLVDAILSPGLELEDLARYVPDFNLSVLSTGKWLKFPYEALKSPRLGTLLTQARSVYDYIILDPPPVVPVPDCRLIAKWVDGFAMVVAADRTPREALEEAFSLMGPKKVLGLVFNGYDRSAMRYYGYEYGYY